MIGMKYLIMSTENFCIYTMTPRVLMANALVAGDGDSLVRSITTANCPDATKITDRNYFYDKVWMIEMNSSNLTEVDPRNVSDSWRHKRDILRMRQDLFFGWETMTFAALAGVQSHAWEHFDVTALAEIGKCDPSNNRYTWLIEEYARVVGSPVEEAYKELKLRIESNDIKKFRIQAMAEKWKHEINQIITQDDALRIKAAMFRDFWGNSMI